MRNDKTSQTFFAVVLLLVAMASIQSGASIAKGLFGVMNPQGVTALRLIFSSLILAAIWRPWRYRMQNAERLSILLYGASLGSMNLLFYLALQRIPLGVAVALEFTGPLVVALCNSKRKSDFLWIALAVLGLSLLFPYSEELKLDYLGVIYALAAGACWGLYIIFGQKAGGHLPGGVTATMGMLVAAGVVLPFGIIYAGSDLFNYSFYPVAIAVAVLSSALPYSLEMLALKRLPTKTFSILMSLEPALAALSGLLILNEQLELTQWVAIMFLISASVGTTLSARRS